MQMEGATAVIQGVERLTGAPVMAERSRAASLGFGGTEAEGVTEGSRVYHIDRVTRTSRRKNEANSSRTSIGCGLKFFERTAILAVSQRAQLPADP